MYDLELHLRTRHGTKPSYDHGLSNGNEQAPVSVGQGYANADDEIAEREWQRRLAMQGASDIEVELERLAAEGGEFWVGGRRNEDQEEAVIDPVLRFLDGDMLES